MEKHACSQDFLIKQFKTKLKDPPPPPPQKNNKKNNKLQMCDNE